MENMLIVRQADSRDADTIIAFNQSMAMETEHRELPPDIIGPGVRALFRNPERGFYIVAVRGDVIAGSLMITREWSDWRNGMFWWIQSVYVRPEFRRQGIYRRMHRFIRELAAADPEVYGFRLYVEKNNHIAQSTYRSLGMEETHYRMFEERL